MLQILFNGKLCKFSQNLNTPEEIFLYLLTENFKKLFSKFQIITKFKNKIHIFNEVQVTKILKKKTDIKSRNKIGGIL